MIKNHNKGIVLCLFIFLAGCGDFTSGGDRVSININQNPSTAGTVLTSGGDEVGNSAEFLAVPNQSWQFAGWSGDHESFENPLVMVLEDDVQLTANFALFRNDYSFELYISDQQAEVEMGFGQIPGATDFFDSGTDLEAPPPPPGESLHAWFETPNKKLFQDFRNAFSNEQTWTLKIQSGSRDVVYLNWTYLQDSFTGSLTLTDQDGTFILNMFDQNDLELNTGQIDELLIIFSTAEE